MAEDKSIQEATTHTLPEFLFRVEISELGTFSCKEASGLDFEFDVIEYRSGDMPGFHKIKMPGLRKSGEVTLKQVRIKENAKLMDWLDTVKTGTIKRVNVTIALLDATDNPVQRWHLANVWPKKYTVGSHQTDDNCTSIKTIVLAHEGLTLA